MALKDLKGKTWVDRRRARAINSQIMLVWLVRLSCLYIGGIWYTAPLRWVDPRRVLVLRLFLVHGELDVKNKAEQGHALCHLSPVLLTRRNRATPGIVRSHRNRATMASVINQAEQGHAGGLSVKCYKPGGTTPRLV